MTEPRDVKPPRFNHVALSLPAAALDEAGRKEIVEFYADCFGWEEYPTMTEDGKRLVLGARRADQFVFLIAEDEPMTSPRMDHFGMAVASMDDFDVLCDRVRSWTERDDRVDFIDKHVDDQGVVKIWSFYVRHLLPMMLEVQYFDWSPEVREFVEAEASA
ncbi:MAG TPA: hypothetical protein VM618_13105 [Acidimicrobiia bacterium]|nr:hypothetical protein [Acidimicrobiia bacterium]